MHGRGWVQVSQVPSDMCGICPAEALLDHVHVQDVDLAKIYPAQRETTYSLVAVCLGPALVVDFFQAGAGQRLQVVAVVVVLQMRLSSKQMGQTVPVSIHDQPKRLLL